MRSDIAFQSDDATLRGWLYRPNAATSNLTMAVVSEERGAAGLVGAAPEG